MQEYTQTPHIEPEEQLPNLGSVKERLYVLGILDEVKKYIPIENHMTMLEVGCGCGRFSKYLNLMCSLTVMDISAEDLRKNPVERRCRMDALNLAFPEKSSNVAFCHFVLHHLEELEKAASEMARIAAEFLVFIEPNRFHYYNMLLAIFDPEERQLWKYSMKRIQKAAELCGYQRVASFSVGLLPSQKIPDKLVSTFSKLNFHQPFGWDEVLIMQRAN